MVPLIIFDLESGGFNYNQNPITEIALSVVDAKTLKIIEQYQTYIKPYDDLVIEKEALEATQLSMKDINNGALINKVLVELIALFKKYKKGKQKPILVGHNSSEFDIPYLQYTFEQRNKDLFEYVSRFHMDTWPMMKLYERGLKGADDLSYKLGVLCERYGIKLIGAHGAAADVDATWKILKILLNKYKPSDGTGDSVQADIHTTSKSRRHFEM